MTTSLPSKATISWKDWGIILISLLTLLSTSYQFYFREILREAQRPTTLAIEARLERVAERNGLVFVRVRLQASNPSDRRVYVPAMWYSVIALAVPVEPCTSRAKWGEAKARTDPIVVPTYNPLEHSEIVAQRRLFAEQAWWDPKDVTTFDDIVALPADRFDYLKLHATYVAARSLKGLHSDPVLLWAIGESNAWQPLLMTSRFHQALQDAAGTDATAKAAMKGDVVRFSELNARLRDLYWDEVARWSESAASGENYFEAVLEISSASGDSSKATGGPTRSGLSKRRAVLPACPE